MTNYKTVFRLDWRIGGRLEEEAIMGAEDRGLEFWVAFFVHIAKRGQGRWRGYLVSGMILFKVPLCNYYKVAL